MSYRLAVVIPAYNERERLPATLAAIARAIPTLAPAIETVLVLVVDNLSTDGTGELAAAEGRRLGLPLSVIPCPIRGKANAVLDGVEVAARHGSRPDGVLFMDADNATDLTEIRVIDPDAREAIWIASRHLPGSVIVHPDGDSPLRRLMSWGMRRLTRLLLGLPLSDTQCGFKLVPTRLALPLYGAVRDRSWIFDAELLALAHRAGISIREFPVVWTEMAGSKVSPLRDALRSLRALAQIAWGLRRRRREIEELRAATR